MTGGLSVDSCRETNDKLELHVKMLIAKQLGKTPSQLHGSLTFKEDLRADSLDFVALVLALEDELKLELSDADAAGIRTVQDAIEIYRRLSTKRPT